MIGPYALAVGFLIKRWWFGIVVTLLLWYCIWLFIGAIEAYMSCQMHYWYQNLGM